MSGTTAAPAAIAAPSVGFISVTDHEAAIADERRKYQAMQTKLNEEIVRLRNLLGSSSALPLSTETLELQPGDESLHQEGAALDTTATLDTASTASVPMAVQLRDETPSKKAANKQHIKWNLKFDELVAYKEQFGHCNVPARDPTYKGLASWVVDQRSGRRLLREGKASHLHPDRIRRLDGVGFLWSISKSKSLDFYARIEQLKAFKARHGHCNVPQKTMDPVGLGNFCMEQRRRYKRFMAGETTFMNQDRVNALQALGFEWSLRKRGPSKGASPDVGQPEL
jgi:hypothetical protein